MNEQQKLANHVGLLLTILTGVFSGALVIVLMEALGGSWWWLLVSPLLFLLGDTAIVLTENRIIHGHWKLDLYDPKKNKGK